MLKNKDNMNQKIKCESKIFCCGADGGIKDYQIISYFDKNRNLVKEETICLNDKLKAVYKANIYEYESGRIDILYECDKDNNDECSKVSCKKYDYCKHTLNKKYAKNYINHKNTDRH